jgi:hypothetical protein
MIGTGDILWLVPYYFLLHLFLHGMQVMKLAVLEVIAPHQVVAVDAAQAVVALAVARVAAVAVVVEIKAAEYFR